MPLMCVSVFMYVKEEKIAGLLEGVEYNMKYQFDSGEFLIHFCQGFPYHCTDLTGCKANIKPKKFLYVH